VSLAIVDAASYIASAIVLERALDKLEDDLCLEWETIDTVLA
jgi:hypothetical protein